MAAQYLSTSRLANVIQLITLGRQTGILRVVRGHGATREMGQIQFVDGQPTAALLGTLTGGAAMNVMTNWGESYYAFDDAVVAEDGHLETQEGVPLTLPPAGSPGVSSGSWPSANAGWGGPPSGALGSDGSAPSASSWPAYGYQSPVPPQTRPPATPSTPSTPSSPLPAMSPMPSVPPMPAVPYVGRGPSGGLSGSLPGFSSSQPGMGGSYPPGPHPAIPAVAVGAPAAIPRRTSRADLNEPLPLDRRERVILLLVDGRRSLEDLARLTRRSGDEVQAVLANLRMLGLVE